MQAADLSWLPGLGELVRVGHRGAPAEAPANTLRGYRRAAELGCHLVEVDVHETTDGHLVLSHDAVLQGPQGPVRIAESTAAVVRALDVGGDPPPLLVEALDLLRGRTGILIDLKGVGFERRLVRTLQQHHMMARAILCGSNLDSLLEARAADPTIGLSWTLDPGQPMRGGIDVPDTPTPWVTVNHHKLFPESIEAFHERGVRVLAWTVDLPDRVATLLAWGVDGITSNDPAMVRTVFRAAGHGRHRRGEAE